MDRLKAMENFVGIADSGSLSSAAELTGQSVASIVRSLASLERYLGVRLLNRSTRRIALTDEGQTYLVWCRRVLQDFHDMESQLEASDGVVRGVLRLTAPVEFGQRFLAPIVNDFLKAHSTARVELSLNDHVVPLLDERLDLALRIGHLPDSAMVAMKVGTTQLVACASPEYLSSAPAIKTPQSLLQHTCISLAQQGRGWHFRYEGAKITQEILPRLECNQARAVRLACLQGVGVCRLMHYQVADELNDGRLIRILKEFEPTPLPIQLVYPHSLHLSPRVKAFVDWAFPKLQEQAPDPKLVRSEPAPLNPEGLVKRGKD